MASEFFNINIYNPDFFGKNHNNGCRNYLKKNKKLLSILSSIYTDFEICKKNNIIHKNNSQSCYCT